MLEFGLLPGTPVEVTGRAPLGGPIAFRCRGAVIALRPADAALVEVA